MTFEGKTWFNYVLYSLFAAGGFLGNSLVIYVMAVRRRSFLQKPYSIFIFNLAVIDCTTSVVLVFSRYLFLPPIPKGDDLEVEVYCRTVWLAWIPFTLGYISIYTCLALTIERWLAVARPLRYCAVKPKHAILTVGFVWVLGAVLNISTLFRVKYDVTKKECTWTVIPGANDQLPWMDFTLQSLAPFVTMVVLNGHIYYTMKNRPNISSSSTCGNQLKKVTIVAVVASSALIISWLPGRITFMMTKFGILKSGSVINTTFNAIAFSNSCINPFLYGIYSSQFRGEYFAIFNKMVACLKCPSTSSFVAPDN